MRQIGAATIAVLGLWGCPSRTPPPDLVPPDLQQRDAGTSASTALLDPVTTGEVSRFHPDGSYDRVPYRVGRLPSGAVIDGVPCSNAETGLWADGHLWYCFATGPFVSGGLRYLGNGTVYFAPGGVLQQATLAAPAPIGTFRCAAGGTLSHYDDGQFKGCVTEVELTFEGAVCRAGQQFELWENGRLRECLAGGNQFQGVPCKEGTMIEAWQNGEKMAMTLGAAFQLNGVTWPAGTNVDFWNNGRLNHVTLEAPDLRFNGRTHVCYGSDGHLQENQLACGR
jgi:hypothetical protein